MNILGIGIDIVDTERVSGSIGQWGNKFLEKVFTEKELEQYSSRNFSVEHMAGKFAAKEAVKKSIPDGARIGLDWRCIEILNRPDGMPYVHLHGEAKKIADMEGVVEIMISISHTHKTAVSNALAVGKGA